MEAVFGKIVSSVTGAETGSKQLEIHFSDGTSIAFYHEQDCCEHVSIDDVCGDFSDFIGQPLTSIEERTSDPDPDAYTDDSGTWTFYEYTCPKGSITVRWLGESNGYYSESVEWSITHP